MDKVLSIVGPGLPGLLILFMWVSAHFKIKNYYSLACARQKYFPWKLIGDLLFVAAVTVLVKAFRGDFDVTTGIVILGMGVPLALSFCAYAGFDFTLSPEDETTLDGQ